MLPSIVTVNPFGGHRKVNSMAKRRRAHHKRQKNRFRHRARAHNAYRHRRHRRRAHNPFSVRGLTGSVMPALIGAGGAVLTDVAMAYLPVPASLQTGWMNILTRAAVAVGVGYVAGMVVGRQTGKEVAAGGLIVVAYSGLKQALAPTLGTSIKGLSGLADFGDYRAAIPYAGESQLMAGGGMGAYMQPRMGAYMANPAIGGRFSGLGAYMNPGSIVSPFAGAAARSPIAAKQWQGAIAGGRFGGFHGYDSESM
jgi:hypothetical protein